VNQYRVLLRGQNFLLNYEGKVQRLGFYTTRFVEADNEAAAEEKALARLRDDPTLRAAVLNEQSDPPMMFIEEISQLDSFDGLNLPGVGLSFYAESEPS
jgi:hypothetical protein